MGKMFDILDFDANFKAYTDRWIQLNKDKFKTYEQMEEAMPQVYMRWLNSPAAFLSGETPANYFRKYDSAPELVKWLRLYDENGVSAPDLLLDRINDLGAESVKPLLYLAKDERNSAELRMLALNLLKEVDAGDAPKELCLRLIDQRQDEDELADMAAELMRNMMPAHAEEVLSRLGDVSESARETYLDLLSDCPGDDRIFEATLKEFEARPEKCGLFSALLGKLGDDRAIEALTRALDRENISYIDYIEVRNAIEELGGECSHERDFEGDPYYEMMKRGEGGAEGI